jgi:Putative serine esterase (DUF676)
MGNQVSTLRALVSAFPLAASSCASKQREDGSPHGGTKPGAFSVCWCACGGFWGHAERPTDLCLTVKKRTFQYHSTPKGAQHLIIYVHGFIGGLGTFKNDQKKFLHEYLSEDILSQCCFASFSYHSRLLEFKLVRKCARIIPFIGRAINPSTNQHLDRNADLLRTYYNSLRDQYKTISFICHSMGGLLVKQFLIAEFTLGRLHPGFYITLATPHQGVAGAAMLGIAGHKQIEEMAPFSERLDNLARDWPKVSQCINSKYYCGIDDDIVHERSSFARDERDRLSTVEGTHISICKPTTSDCALVRNLNLVVCDYLRLDTGSPVQSADLKDYVLFQSYRHEYQPFYLLRKLDELLLHTLADGNVWIIGPSGSGKTVFIQHALVECSNTFFYIDLSPCCMSSRPLGYFQSILDGIRSICKSRGMQLPEIEPRQTSPETVIQDISNLLKALPNDCPIYIFIDEVSLTDGHEFAELSAQLLSLVTYHTNRMDTANVVRFIVASGLSPKDCLQSVSRDKFDTLFSLIDIKAWADNDVKLLVNLICNALALKFSSEDQTLLLAFSKGSPRRLKDCLRKYLQLQRASVATVAEAIAQAGHEEVV